MLPISHFKLLYNKAKIEFRELINLIINFIPFEREGEKCNANLIVPEKE